jgi:uncharacterized repeat protein (TIGR01451 family)
MGVDRAPADEWYRLVNFEVPTYEDVTFPCANHTNHLNDMDDDGTCGNGELNFAGPTWDFYLQTDKSFTVHTSGFEQDCYDDHFGSGHFSLTTYIDCHFGNFLTETANDWGNNDALPPLDASLGGSGVDPLSLIGDHNLGVTGEFDFDFTLSEIPQTDEDQAELSVTKSCEWEGEVALAGEPFTCTIVVSNSGPGLPRNVVVADTLTSTLAADDYLVGDAIFRVGTDEASFPCGPSSSTGFSCEVRTVAVGGTVTIEVEITPLKAGSFSNGVAVSTDSSEEVLDDNEAGANVDVFLSVPVDIQPGSADNTLNLGKRGLVSVAILSEDGFDATTLDVVTACFGDAEEPGQRTCDEAHGQVHLEDADKDKDIDLVFHFSVGSTGIDPGDSTACLKGTTADGTGFYGCDAITIVP